MFTLRGRQDNFRLIFPKEFLDPEIEEKYAKILQEKHSFIYSPIDFLNETIQNVQVLGFQEATVEQLQTGRGTYTDNPNRINQNKFLHTASSVSYRSEKNPIDLIDKTLNVTFRHTLGFVNYFMMFENFFYLYQRDTEYNQMIPNLFIDIMDNIGNIYSRVEIIHPIISGIDMLDLNFTMPQAQSQTFKVEFKYSNLDYQFIQNDDEKQQKNLITFI